MLDVSSNSSKMSTQRTIPEEFGFLWSIDEVKAKEERKLMVSGKELRNDYAAYNFPPRKEDRFKRKKGKLYRWRKGVSTQVEMSEDMRKKWKYSTASVFFQPRQDNFLALRKDCTQQKLNKDDDLATGWCQIGFHHLEGNLSQVDYVGQFRGLAARGGGSTWMPQILPTVYECFLKRNEDLTGGLCGHLAILMGMAAFSTDAGSSEQVIIKCFKMGQWRSHDQEIGIGRYEKDRVVVATIYLDPAIPQVTAKTLKSFENGEFGPIFAATPQPLSSNYKTSSESIPGGMSAIPRTSLNAYGGSTAASMGYARRLSTSTSPIPQHQPQPPAPFGIPGPRGIRLPEDEADDEDGEYYQSDEIE